VSVTPLAGGLSVGDDCGSGFRALFGKQSCLSHGGVDALKVAQIAAWKLSSDEFDIEPHLNQTAP